MKQSDILVRPYVTEKALNLMGGTAAQGYKDGNKIEFIVNRDADKADIKAAFEERFEVKVERVWTRIQKDGKLIPICLHLDQRDTRQRTWA